MQTPEWIETFEVKERDLIILRLNDFDDSAVEEIIQMLHHHFPGNMILFLQPGETIEGRSEEEAVEMLKAIADHQEYREHKALTEGDGP